MIYVHSWLNNLYLVQVQVLCSTTPTIPRQRSLRSISSTLVISGGSGNEKLSLQQVFEDEQLIDCLFKQLADEFFVELLLALIEFIQFHDLMVEDTQFMDTIQGMISSRDTRMSVTLWSRKVSSFPVTFQHFDYVLMELNILCVYYRLNSFKHDMVNQIECILMFLIIIFGLIRIIVISI